MWVGSPVTLHQLQEALQLVLALRHGFGKFLNELNSSLRWIVGDFHAGDIFFMLTVSHFGTQPPSTGTQPRRIFDCCVPKGKRVFMQNKIRVKMKDAKKSSSAVAFSSALPFTLLILCRAIA